MILAATILKETVPILALSGEDNQKNFSAKADFFITH
jgi:hypothetical protein